MDNKTASRSTPDVPCLFGIVSKIKKEKTNRKGKWYLVGRKSPLKSHLVNKKMTYGSPPGIQYCPPEARERDQSSFLSGYPAAR